MLFPATSQPRGSHRVVITGAGIFTALGQGWTPNAEGFRAGRTAFRQVSLFDVSRHRVKVAAEADLPSGPPPGRLNARQLARLDRPSTMLLWAAREAWQQAGWERTDHLPLVLGTTAGGMSLGEDYFRQAARVQNTLGRDAWPRRPGSEESGRLGEAALPRHRGQATRALYYQSQVQGRLVLDALGFSGPITIISNACASGSNAVGHAWEIVRSGQAACVLAGGYDTLSQLVFSGFDALQALSPTTCRPFDASRDGLALGEGAAMLALETLENARRRGANILGELAGYGTTIDQHHLTQPHPEGDAAAAAMALACESARVMPEDVDYLNAHGTGTSLNDSSEALAIRRWAGHRAATLPVSSTKASIGHLLGAAGAVEAVVCLMALREQWLPPEIAFENPDPACDFPIVRQPQDASVNVVLSNSFGFGGVNATLVLRRWQ